MKNVILTYDFHGKKKFISTNSPLGEIFLTNFYPHKTHFIF
ncbi:hypothetical protein SAMN05421761_102243 [Belliella pelovolcani]|uniref:Uncharacterized protein n=1 Tax=Belliella pelovolcani TaxID=529505 RepID=A0A1N7KPA5_9BACT|nr:hypothetical protein SAMN05421761_102243 [Belliella pelovolcani]